ncbi:MAG TPA: helix-turn-helix transcriptional regulator [Polyangia bacterium]|nr:helix-turn-helix transcriptional regulator [Polyangia bacterium]
MPRKHHNLSSSADMVRTRIRELRTERRLTQEQLCDLAGISRDAVSRIESGSRTPSLDTLERIIRALGGSWTDVLGSTPRALRGTSPHVTRVVAMLEHQPVERQRVVEALVRAYLRVEKTRDNAAGDGLTTERAAERPASYSSAAGRSEPGDGHGDR